MRNSSEIPGYEQLSKCVDTIGGTKGLRARWKKLSDEERASYAEKAKDGKSKPFDYYFGEQLAQELETRDPRWLTDGTLPEIDYSRNPRESYGAFIDSDAEDLNAPKNIAHEKHQDEWKDLFAHDKLRESGFNVSANPPQARGENGSIIDGITNPDIWIGGILYEIKSPHDKCENSSDNKDPKKSLRFVKNNLSNARDNFNNPYDNEAKQGMGNMREETRVVLNLKYKTCDEELVIEEAKVQKEKMRIKDVLVVKKDGTVIRI